MIDTNVGGTVWTVRSGVPALLAAGGGEDRGIGRRTARAAPTRRCTPCRAGRHGRSPRPRDTASGSRPSAPPGSHTEFATGTGRTPDLPGALDHPRHPAGRFAIPVPRQPPGPHHDVVVAVVDGAAVVTVSRRRSARPPGACRTGGAAGPFEIAVVGTGVAFPDGHGVLAVAPSGWRTSRVRGEATSARKEATSGKWVMAYSVIHVGGQLDLEGVGVRQGLGRCQPRSRCRRWRRRGRRVPRRRRTTW